MIKVEKTNVEIRGKAAELLSDLTLLIKNMNMIFSGIADKETAYEDIMEAVKLGFLSDKEVNKKLKDELNKMKNKCDSESEFDKKIDSMVKKIIKDIKEM